MEKPSYYAIIPAKVRYDKHLTDKAKLLYGEITALCNSNGTCWAGNEYFARLYDVTDVTISNNIGQLKERGYLDIEYERNGECIKKRNITLTVKENLAVKEIFNGTDKENFNGAVKENFKENNTSTNNTSKNNKEHKYSPVKFWYDAYLKEKGTKYVIDIKDEKGKEAKHLKSLYDIWGQEEFEKNIVQFLKENNFTANNGGKLRHNVNILWACRNDIGTQKKNKYEKQDYTGKEEGRDF